MASGRCLIKRVTVTPVGDSQGFDSAPCWNPNCREGFPAIIMKCEQFFATFSLSRSTEGSYIIWTETKTYIWRLCWSIWKNQIKSFNLFDIKRKDGEGKITKAKTKKAESNRQIFASVVVGVVGVQSKGWMNEYARQREWRLWIPVDCAW